MTKISAYFNSVILLFGYIHYRILVFFKRRGDSISEFSATLLVSLMQSLTVMNIIFVAQVIHDFRAPSRLVFLSLLLLLGVMNWYLYEKDFDPENIRREWKQEGDSNRIRNGWLIAIYLVLSFLFPVTLGILEHNFKLI